MCFGLAGSRASGVEVDHAVEGAAGADPLVDRLPLRLLGLAVVAVERLAVERVLERRQRGADDPHALGVRAGDQLLVAGDDVLGRGRRLALGTSIVPGQPMSLMPIISTTVSACGWLSTSRSKRASALSPMRSRRTRAPEMPSFSTATLAPALCSRSARKSGQRWLASRRGAAPSVIESPKVTTAARVGRRVDQDLRQEDPRRDGLRRLEVGVAGEVALGRDVGRLRRLVVPGRGRRDLGQEQADGDAAERRHGEVDRVADDGRAGRDR